MKTTAQDDVVGVSFVKVPSESDGIFVLIRL